MTARSQVDIVFFARTADGASEDVIPLIGMGDAVQSQRHRISATTANHDVEDGVEVTDHYRRNRDPLVLSVVIGNAPIGGPEGVELTRVLDAWTLLERAADEALEAIITTRLKTYESMYLVEGGTEITVRDRDWMRLELTFMPIRKVATELVTDIAPDRDRRPRNDGAVNLQDPTPAESALYDLTGGDTRRLGTTLRDPLGALLGGG